MLDDAFRSIDLKGKALDGSWLRNQVMANNVANANTPGYKRQDVDFQQVLSDFLDQSGTKLVRTDPRHLPMQGDEPSELNFTTSSDDSASYRRDQNGVNIDTEMSEIAKNQIFYSSVTTALNSEIKRLKMAIEGK